MTAGQGKRKVVTRTGGYAERVKADMQPYRSSQTTSSSLDKLPDVIQASRLNPDPEGMTKGRVTLGIIRYFELPVRGTIVTATNYNATTSQGDVRHTNLVF